MTADLFDDLPPNSDTVETPMAPGAVLLHGFARSQPITLLHAIDAITAQPWPSAPLAQAGYANFAPNACLINEYAPGAKLSVHQDKDEKDFAAPIVSVSLGLSAVFLFGTPDRRERPQRYRLVHGDVVVWGGPSRLSFHGVQPLAEGEHALVGRRRINLTFRRVG